MMTRRPSRAPRTRASKARRKAAHTGPLQRGSTGRRQLGCRGGEGRARLRTPRAVQRAGHRRARSGSMHPRAACCKALTGSTVLGQGFALPPQAQPRIPPRLAGSSGLPTARRRGLWWLGAWICAGHLQGSERRHRRALTLLNGSFPDGWHLILGTPVTVYISRTKQQTAPVHGLSFAARRQKEGL